MNIFEQFSAHKNFLTHPSNQVNLQDFILKNQHNFDKETLQFLANQLQARQKAKDKLPTWYANENIIFPLPLSVEQASSELTARYKANLVSGNLIDLTGGMGIDCSFFSSTCETVIYLERNEDLAKITTHNFKELALKNIRCFSENSLEFLEKSTDKFDWIYLDPARRDSAKNKVVKLEDCEPNILSIKELLTEKSKNVLLKTSPLLDISLAIKQLGNVSEVHILAIENEVKELLFIINKTENSTKIIATNLSKVEKRTNQIFSFFVDEEQAIQVKYAFPKNYIYEPNAAVMKAGGFKIIAQKFNLSKLAPNSHLYTSDEVIPNFVGRSFKCEAVCKFDKKEIMRYLSTPKANIAVRNFPFGAEEVRKKLGLQDGGNTYLFATENVDKQKIILICQKI